jgi:putative CocE/NonD family hydrolase
LPYKKGSSALRLLPNYEQWALDIQNEGDYNAYWRQRGYAIEHYYDEHADVPTIYLGGWYDSYTRGTTDNYIALSRMKRSAQHLIMGPWTHGGWGVSYAGDVDFGPDSVMDDYNGYRLRWFDRWLKGIDNGVDREPPVRIFVMGGGSGRKDRNGRLLHLGAWRTEPDWPLPPRNIYHTTCAKMAAWAPICRSPASQAATATTRAIRCRPSAGASRRGCILCRQERSTNEAIRAFTAVATRCLWPPGATYWSSRRRRLRRTWK